MIVKVEVAILERDGCKVRMKVWSRNLKAGGQDQHYDHGATRKGVFSGVSLLFENCFST